MKVYLYNKTLITVAETRGDSPRLILFLLLQIRIGSFYSLNLLYFFNLLCLCENVLGNLIIEMNVHFSSKLFSGT